MANELLPLPETLLGQRTPLMDMLLAIICVRNDCIRRLEETIRLLRDEIAILQRQMPRPEISPSQWEMPPRPAA